MIWLQESKELMNFVKSMPKDGWLARASLPDLCLWCRIFSDILQLYTSDLHLWLSPQLPDFIDWYRRLNPKALHKDPRWGIHDLDWKKD
jgi:hypothetical protein